MDIRVELLATVATLYYKLNKSQSEIAARLDISSSTVSRMLREAHERGVVEITIKSPIPRDFELEQRFLQTFGLKDVYILQTASDSTNSEALLHAIGGLAAGYVERMLANYQPGSSIGVAWGTGVHATVNAIEDNYTQNIDVVQLLGGVGALVVDSPDLARMVAQKLGERHYDLHSPVLLERASTRHVFLQEPTVRDAIERAKAVKLAITGIGTVHDEASSFLRAGLLTRNDLRSLRESGVVGEMCGRFFDINGSQAPYEINQRIVGIELDDLRHIPQSIAIARGPLKAASILGALCGNFVKVLATDDITARAVLKVQQEMG